MWLISFLPDWIFHLVLLAGILGLIASYVLRFVPFISQYTLPIRVGALLLTIFGVYMEGGLSNEAAWQEKVAQAEKRALAAEAKAAKENVRIVTKTVEKLKVVRDTQYIIKQEIVEKAAAIDAQCVVAPEAIDILNQAATRGESK